MKIKFIQSAAVITCDPVTIAATAAVVGAGVSGYSTYQAGQSQKEAGEYNAEMDRRKAQDALQRGAMEASTKRDQARKVASSQAEAGAMSNVDISSGTPLDLLTETTGLGELAARRVQNNAMREAWGLQAQATLDEFQGDAAGRAGTLNAAGTFLGGASSAYLGYKAAKR